MALSITTTQPGANSDYFKYLSDKPVKTDRVNEPSFMDFTLVPYDGSFVKLKRGAYVTFSTSTYGKWFTGYITNDPQLEYLGNQNNVPVYGYKYQATDDAYILNMKQLGIIPPFINTTYGSILRSLVNILDPAGTFNTNFIQDGYAIARYVIDPNKKFSEVVKDLAESSSFRFRALDKELFFEPIDTELRATRIQTTGGTTIIKYVHGSEASQNGVSYRIRVRVYNNGANDITVYSNQGGIVKTCSPGKFLDFDATVVGNGTGVPQIQFRTTNAAESLDIYAINPSILRLSDKKEFVPQAERKFVTNWGANNGAVATITQDIEMPFIWVDGNSKHFTPSRLEAEASVDPIINEAVVVGGSEPQEYVTEYFVGDSITASFPLISPVYGVERSLLLSDDFSSGIDTQKWDAYDTVNNWLQVANGYLNVLGGNGTSSYDVFLRSKTLIPLEGNLRVTHGEYDFVDSGANGTAGYICGLWKQNPNSSLNGCAYAIQVTRSGGNTTTLKPVVNGAVDGSQSFNVDHSKRYIIRTSIVFSVPFRYMHDYPYVDSTGKVNQNATSAPGQLVPFFQTHVSEINPSDGSVTNTFSWSNQATISETYAYYVPVASNDLHCTVTSITISTPLQASLSVKPAGGSTYAIKNIGQNEIDAMDGQSPAATIIQDGKSVGKNSVLGNKQFNPGQAQLVFFKDSTKQVSATPGIGDYIKLVYRAVGYAIGRIRNSASITSEASSWGDNGLRSLTRTDISPAPRTSSECELAANALLQEQGFQHFEGSYTQYSPYEFTAMPIAGAILRFRNMPSAFPTTLTAELINEVKTTMMNSVRRELFEHVISFGKQDYVKKALAGLASGDNYAPTDDIELPEYISTSALNAAYAPDVVAPTLVNFDSSNFNFDTQQTPPGKRNLLIRSEEFDVVSVWNGSNFTVSANSAVAPDGNTTAETVTTTSTTHNMRQQVTVVPGLTYTFSWWAKLGTMTDAKYSVWDFTNSTNIIAPTSYAASSSQWTRFSVTFTAPTNCTSVGVYPIRDSGVIGTIYLWGGQLEQGSFPGIYKKTTTAPVYDGGFEVRYTDDGWGAEDGRNLITRTQGTQTFSVPRNARGKVCFVKAYELKNYARYSEDFSVSQWAEISSAASVTNSMKTDPDGNMSLISSVTWTSGATTRLSQNSAITCDVPRTVAFSISIKGPAGKAMQLQVRTGTGNAINKNITLTGGWQRETVSGTLPVSAGNFVTMWLYSNEVASLTCDVTRASLELGTTTETIYCKTKATPYGVLSRYASCLRVSFPLVPPAPTASLDYTDVKNPKVNITLPNILQDVWGVEVRAGNNSTVLYKKDLTDAGYFPVYTQSANTVRALDFYVYTYNLLGEYCASPVHLTGTIPTPIASGLTIDDADKTIKWTGSNVTGYKLIVATDAGYTTKIVDTTTTNPFYQLAPIDYYQQRYVKVTPFDLLGDGTPITLSHIYSPPAPTLTSAEVGYVEKTATSGTVSVPGALSDYSASYIKKSREDGKDGDDNFGSGTFRIGSIWVKDVKVTDKNVVALQIEIYSDAGLTNRVQSDVFYDIKWDGTYMRQGSLRYYSGLTWGSTYYVRAGFIGLYASGTTWSSAYTITVGDATPPASTYTATYDISMAGITAYVTPASVASDHDRFEATWTYDGSTPANSAQTKFKSYGTAAFNFFVVGIPGKTIKLFVRAVDKDGNAQNWVTLHSGILLPSIGDLSSTKNQIINPGFEVSSVKSNTILCLGWDSSNTTGTSIDLSAANARSGNRYAEWSGAAGTFAVLRACLDTGALQYIEVKPGDIIYFGAYLRRQSGDAGVNVVLEATDKDKANPTYNNTAQVTASSWTLSSATYTVPASGVKYVRLYLQIMNNGTVSTTARADDAFLIQVLNPATDEIAKRGSMPPAYAGSMTYTSTTSSITWSWNITIYRTDGTTVSSNSSQLISGLSSNTTYYFYPYYDEILGVVSMLITGGVGSPAWAHTATSRAKNAEQAYQSHIPLSLSAMSAATTSAGSGGGGGGGDGGCVIEGTLVHVRRNGEEVILPAEEVVVGDYLRTLDKHGSWLRVNRVLVKEHSEWMRFTFTNGERLTVTSTHPFTLAEDEGCKRATEMTVEDAVFTTTGIAWPSKIEVLKFKARKVSITLDSPHTFFAGSTTPSILTHNSIAPS